MSFIYKLKSVKPNPELVSIDNAKRLKVEEAMGKKLTDFEWVRYKQMTLPKNKYT